MEEFRETLKRTSESETGENMGEKGCRLYCLYPESASEANIFGWVDLIPGSYGITKWISGNTDGFIQVLRKILYRFKGKTIDLLVDNARWHKRYKSGGVYY